jgi:hypothetical protein
VRLSEVPVERRLQAAYECAAFEPWLWKHFKDAAEHPSDRVYFIAA